MDVSMSELNAMDATRRNKGLIEEHVRALWL